MPGIGKALILQGEFWSRKGVCLDTGEVRPSEAVEAVQCPWDSLQRF